MTSISVVHIKVRSQKVTRCMAGCGGKKYHIYNLLKLSVGYIQRNEFSTDFKEL
jgi:hypothetical protein